MVSADDLTLPEANDVHLAPHTIGMPLERILLIRKDLKSSDKGIIADG